MFKKFCKTLKNIKDAIRMKIIGYDYYIVDELGGMHSDGVGWAPNGEFCGECTRETCVGCGPWSEQGYVFNNDVEDI